MSRTLEHVLIEKGLANQEILTNNTIMIAISNRDKLQSIPEIMQASQDQSSFLGFVLFVASDIACALDKRCVSMAEEYLGAIDGMRTKRHTPEGIDTKRMFKIAAGGADATTDEADAMMTFNPDTERVLGKDPYRIVLELVPSRMVHTRKCTEKCGDEVRAEWTMPAGGDPMAFKNVDETRKKRLPGDTSNAWAFGETFVPGDVDSDELHTSDLHKFDDEPSGADEDSKYEPVYLEVDPQNPFEAINSMANVAEIRFIIILNPVAVHLFPTYAESLMQALERRASRAGDAGGDEVLRSLADAEGDASVSSDVVFDTMMRRVMEMWSHKAIQTAVEAQVGYQNMVESDNPFKALFVNLAPERVIASTMVRFKGADTKAYPASVCCAPREYRLPEPSNRAVTVAQSGTRVMQFRNSVLQPLTGQNMTVRGVTMLTPMFQNTPERWNLALQYVSEMMRSKPRFKQILTLFFNTPQERQMRVYDQWVDQMRLAKASRQGAVLRLEEATRPLDGPGRSGGPPDVAAVASRFGTWADTAADVLGKAGYLTDTSAADAADAADAELLDNFFEDADAGGGQLGFAADDLEDADVGADAPVPSTVLAAPVRDVIDDPDEVIQVGPNEVLGVHHYMAVMGMNPPSVLEMSRCRTTIDTPAIADLVTCPLDTTDRCVTALAAQRQAYRKQVEPFQKAIYTMSTDGSCPLPESNSDAFYKAQRAKAKFHRQLLESMHQMLDRTLGAPNKVEIFTGQMKKTIREMQRRLAKEAPGKQMDSLASRSVGCFMGAHATAGDDVTSRFFTMLMTDIASQMGMVDHHDLVALIWTSCIATADVLRLNHPAPNIILTGKPGLGKSNVMRQTMRIQALKEMVGSASEQATVSEESIGSGAQWTDEFTPESRGLQIKARGRASRNQANNTLEATWKQLLEAGWCSRRVVNLNKHDPRRGRSVDKLRRRSTALYVEIGNLEPSDFSDALLDRYEIYYWVRQRRLDGLELTAAEIANDATTSDMKVLQYFHAWVYRLGGMRTRAGTIAVPTVKFGGTVLAAYQAFLDDDDRGKLRCIPMFNGWSPRTGRRCRSVASGIAAIRALVLSMFMTDNGLVMPNRISEEAYRAFLFNALNVVKEADAAKAWVMYSSVMVPTAAPVMAHCLQKAMMMQQSVADRSSWKTKFKLSANESWMDNCTAISAKSARVMPDYIMLEVQKGEGQLTTWIIAKAIARAATDRDGLETSTVNLILEEIMKKEWPSDTAWLNDILNPPGTEKAHPVDARLRACDSFGFDIGEEAEAYVKARNDWDGILTDADTMEARRIMADAEGGRRAGAGASVGAAFMARFNGGRSIVSSEPAEPAVDSSTLPERTRIAIMREKLAQRPEFKPRSSRMVAFPQTLVETEEDDAGGVNKFVRTFFVVRKDMYRILTDPASVFVRVVKNCATPYTQRCEMAVPVFVPGMPSVPRRMTMEPNPAGRPFFVTNKQATRMEDAARELEEPPNPLGVPSITRKFQHRVVVERREENRVPITECIDKTAHVYRLTAAGISENQVIAVSRWGDVFTPRNIHTLEYKVCQWAAEGRLEGTEDLHHRRFPLDYMGSPALARKIVAHAEATAPGCTGLSMPEIMAAMNMVRQAQKAKSVSPWSGDDLNTLNPTHADEEDADHPAPPVPATKSRVPPRQANDSPTSVEYFNRLPSVVQEDGDLDLGADEEALADAMYADEEDGLTTTAKRTPSPPKLVAPVQAPAAIPPPPREEEEPQEDSSDDDFIPEGDGMPDGFVPWGKRGDQRPTSEDTAPPSARRRRLS